MFEVKHHRIPCGRSFAFQNRVNPAVMGNGFHHLVATDIRDLANLCGKTCSFLGNRHEFRTNADFRLAIAGARDRAFQIDLLTSEECTAVLDVARQHIHAR